MLRREGDKFFLQCNIVPGSREEKIVGRVGNALKIKLTAVPEGGKANKALIRFLATQCCIKPGAISIVRGAGSRRKILCLDGVTNVPRCLLPYLH